MSILQVLELTSNVSVKQAKLLKASLDRFVRLNFSNSLQCIYYRNWSQPDNENQSDDRIETIDSNIFNSSQSNVLFSNPANQMSSTKRYNLNLVAVMHTRLRCRVSINCQAFEF